MSTTIKSICGEIYLDASTGKDPDDNMEIYKADVSCMFWEIIGKRLYMDLSEFKNSAGRTIGEEIVDKHLAKLVLLLEEPEREWQENYKEE